MSAIALPVAVDPIIALFKQYGAAIPAIGVKYALPADQIAAAVQICITGSWFFEKWWKPLDQFYHSGVKLRDQFLNQGDFKNPATLVIPAYPVLGVIPTLVPPNTFGFISNQVQTLKTLGISDAELVLLGVLAPAPVVVPIDSVVPPIKGKSLPGFNVKISTVINRVRFDEVWMEIMRAGDTGFSQFAVLYNRDNQVNIPPKTPGVGEAVMIRLRYVKKGVMVGEYSVVIDLTTRAS